MNYRKLGRHGVKVSEISYGSWITGNDGAAEASIACHKRAFDLGINFFDTADAYASGEAEKIVGRVLKDLKRSDIFLATKCFFRMGKGPNDGGLCRKHVREACDASLQRLDTDYIDLLQCHSYDHDTPLDEVCRAFDDLIRQGKLLYWGVSNWSGLQIASASELCERRGFDRPASLQPRYNMFHRDIEKDQLPACAQHGLGIVVYSPLCQGILTGKYAGNRTPEGSRGAGNEQFKNRFLTDYNEAGVRDLGAIAASLGLTLGQLALAWILRKNEISSCIVGASRPEQLDETAKASGITLTEETLARIQAALDKRWAMVLDEDARKLRDGKK
ncbi:MAG: aldo/keto reductase family protein [Planctomycetota bacterium]|nr:aldo/keto reductase family protein [Planctomycetota bacterium]